MNFINFFFVKGTETQIARLIEFEYTEIQCENSVKIKSLISTVAFRDSGPGAPDQWILYNQIACLDEY